MAAARPPLPPRPPAQRGSARATMELMRAPTWICCCPCPRIAVQAKTGDARPRPPVHAHRRPAIGGGRRHGAHWLAGVGLHRQHGCHRRRRRRATPTCTCRRPAVVRVREAIAQVFPLLSAEVPIAVSEGATRALQSGPVRDALRENLLLREFPPQEAAYGRCLTAVHQRRAPARDRWAAGCPRPGVDGERARRCHPRLMREASETHTRKKCPDSMPEEVATESEASRTTIYSNSSRRSPCASWRGSRLPSSPARAQDACAAVGQVEVPMA